jgi:N-acetylglucosaminyldiphosphoundecaprenol N-acetyl-beta-D-mannosaminyltransferase
MAGDSTSPLRPHARQGAPVLGAFIDAISWERALETIQWWAVQRQSRYICACNVHMVMTMRKSGPLNDTVRGADMVLPDGMPVAWMLRRLGFPQQSKVSGPDLMWKFFSLAEASGTRVYFYGSTRRTLELLQARLATAFPDLRVAGMEAPPFRELSPDEDADAVARINASDAGVVFVGLGCPKQELWMGSHRGRVNAVMIGVGAAFDFIAGTVKRAPLWMQRCGLEWAYRLAAEPQRLWRRYLTTNFSFLLGALGQLLRSR